MSATKNSFNTQTELNVGDHRFTYYAINGGEFSDHDGVKRLPVSLKVLLKNLLRHEDGLTCTRDDIEALANCQGRHIDQEIAYHPARVLMQDFTGVPAVVDLAAMRALT